MNDEQAILQEIAQLIAEPEPTPARPPAPVSIPVSLPVMVDVQANRETCKWCKEREGRRCGVDGAYYTDHADSGICPLRIFGTQRKATTTAPERTPTKPLPEKPKPFPLFLQEGQPIYLQGTFRGRSCFLICGGPSFAKLDHSLLRQPGVLTMGINNSPKTFRPNLWVHGDTPSNFLRSIWTDPTIMKFSPLHLRNARIFDSVTWRHTGVTAQHCPNTFFYKLGTGFQADKFLAGESAVWGNMGSSGGCRTTFLVALRLLRELGVSNVYLLGADFHMDPARPYHFEQGRTPGSIEGNQRTYEETIRRCDELAPIFDRTGFHVFNCNPDSKLRSFPMLAYEEAVKRAREEFGEIDVATERTEGLYDSDKHSPPPVPEPVPPPPAVPAPPQSRRANPHLPGQQFSNAWYRGHISRWHQWLDHLAGKPNLTYLEIGMWEGGSANFMMRKFFTHPTSRGIGIDPFIQEDRYPVAVNNLRIAAGDRFEVIKGFSFDVMKGGRWDKPEWVDVAYIDGDHATQAVIQDALLTFPLVKVGGLMIFDDYHLARHGCPQGVDAFVRAFAPFGEVLHPTGPVQGTARWQLLFRKTRSLPLDPAAWPVVEPSK